MLSAQTEKQTWTSYDELVLRVLANTHKAYTYKTTRLTITSKKKNEINKKTLSD